MDPVLLSTAYFPPLFYFSRILHSSQVFIEIEENFQKQTYRNRCIISGANGPLNLTVPVQHPEPKIKIRDLKIAYPEKWNLVHLRAIESAYRNSPFYEYYMDDFQPFFKNTYDSLLEFNTSILKTCLSLLKHKGNIEFTSGFIKNSQENDYRYVLTPKKGIDDFYFPEYHQVFGEKFGFMPNLSILDLIFNLGPDSKDYLMLITKKNGQI